MVLFMVQQAQKPSAVPTVFSVISMSFSALAFIFSIVLLIIAKIGPESGGTATAPTNRAVFTVAGMIFFTGFVWIFAMIGGFAGFIMTIVDIATKRTMILWIPVSAMVLSVISILMSTFAF